MKLKNIFFKASSKAELISALQLFIILGKVRLENNKIPPEYIKVHSVSPFAIAGIDHWNNSLTTWSSGRLTAEDDQIFTDLRELAKALADVETCVTVDLNDKHTANVYPDRIEVGCQTFPTDIIAKLAVALKQVSK